MTSDMNLKFNFVQVGWKGEKKNKVDCPLDHCWHWSHEIEPKRLCFEWKIACWRMVSSQNTWRYFQRRFQNEYFLTLQNWIVFICLLTKNYSASSCLCQNAVNCYFRSHNPEFRGRHNLIFTVRASGVASSGERAKWVGSAIGYGIPEILWFFWGQVLSDFKKKSSYTGKNV